MEGAVPNPILQPLVLTDEERSTLERWVRRSKSAQAGLPEFVGIFELPVRHHP